MPAMDSSTDAGSSSSEESEKMVHSRSHDPSQAIPRIPPPSSSGSESDDDSDAVTPPSKTHQQQEQKKEQQTQTQKQKKEQPPPTSPSPSALLSNKTTATKILAKRPSVQSRSPAPSQARPIPPPSSSDASSDDDSEAPTPLTKTHQQQEQKKKQQPQKQKKEQPLPPSPSQSQLPSPSSSPSSSALHSNKTSATKTSAKRSREEESNGIPELPSTKKKMKGQIVQHSDEVPAKEKKKAQKQNVAEALSTPSSPQKSGKKAVQVWNSKDELAFLNGLLAFTKRCKEFPKNMSPVYDYVRNMMDIHYSNKQFGDKHRRLKAKFWSLVENRRANDYNFKSTDEAATYKLCEQLWGVQDDGDDEHYHIAETEGNGSMNGKEKKKKKKQPVEAEDEYEAKTKDGEDQGQEEEQDLKKIKDGEDQGDEEEGGQDETTRNKTMANGLVKCNEGDLERISRELYSKLSKERDDMINEMKHTMVKSLEESQAKTMAMVQDFLLKESQSKTRAMVQDHLLNPRAGQVQLPFSDTMTGILSGRWAPVPNREALEEKWRTQQIVEMEAFSGRLDLMREECKMCLEELRPSASNDRS